MREIKFRIVYKNKINGYERLTEKDGNIFWEWMALDLNPDNGNERWCSGVYPKDFSYLRNQFTGRKDKNGKEIYEGDVVRFKVDFPDQEFDNGVVRWADGGYWTSQTEDDLEELLSEELSDLPGEVIGNIYENPELVTPK